MSLLLMQFLWWLPCAVLGLLHDFTALDDGSRTLLPGMALLALLENHPQILKLRMVDCCSDVEADGSCGERAHQAGCLG